ncbi:MAG: amidase [Chryseolinea sp.]
MKRRKFIRVGATVGITISAVGLFACQQEKSVPKDDTSDKQSFALEEFDIAQLQAAMASGKQTSQSICELYLSRIDAIDKQGVFLNSVIELNPDALAIAAALDQERATKEIRGPLHGIPILIKDNIDTGDKMMTTAGALAMEGNIAARDAFIVRQLRAAGAVILGKTNLSEWANFRSDRSSSGWSSRGGQTRNPYILDRNPCGSSSGSGTAVSANLCAVAIGTETNGSIACPSSINGLVGIKPTVGLVSRSGIIPISHTQDTAGPMARTVRDAAILLGGITGVDPADTITKESEGKIQKDYTKFLDADALAGKRIGVEKSMLKGHEAVDALLQKALDALRSKGAIIVEIDFMSMVKGMSPAPFLVLQYEFKDGLNRYLAGANAKVKTLQDIIAFNASHEAEAMPYFKQDILESSQEKGGLVSKEYQEALKKILSTTRNALDHFLKEEKLDAICAPTNGPSWCTDLVNGDFFTGYGVYGPAAIAGYPHITVPMGQVFGLPVGLSFIGLPYAEGDLISMAYAYEQISKNRRVPEFLKSAATGQPPIASELKL